MIDRETNMQKENSKTTKKKQLTKANGLAWECGSQRAPRVNVNVSEVVARNCPIKYSNFIGYVFSLFRFRISRLCGVVLGFFFRRDPRELGGPH
ncbi:unnamed protein product [Sphenostylis stenocarpa]|uniref:Uncharacterized protein n=1 Tax=Sphenostylis stenocarpa TaxID=92480 RepID=A0AA86SPK4_9FABA|nr:unnamed protein product [Sphenostylis stenocarpa]